MVGIRRFRVGSMEWSLFDGFVFAALWTGRESTVSCLAGGGVLCLAGWGVRGVQDLEKLTLVNQWCRMLHDVSSLLVV